MTEYRSGRQKDQLLEGASGKGQASTHIDGELGKDKDELSMVAAS